MDKEKLAKLEDYKINKGVVATTILDKRLPDVSVEDAEWLIGFRANVSNEHFDSALRSGLIKP